MGKVVSISRSGVLIKLILSAVTRVVLGFNTTAVDTIIYIQLYVYSPSMGTDKTPGPSSRSKPCTNRKN